ncbi:MAG: FAD/NAD(P)-binding protein [Pseudomonadota bacterium]
MKVIAIVGFGFCGRLAFAHLAKNSQNSKIIIFEKNGRNSLGPAFSSFSPHYILNVPVEKMSAFSNQPKSFCEFLEKKYPEIFKEIGENGFAPRRIYGEYLEGITKEAFVEAQENNIEVEFVEDEVVEILPGAIKTKNHNSFQAHETLIATSFKQSNLPFDLNSPNLVKQLWALPKTFHEKNFTNETICLIGSGLTAVDILIGLSKKNFTGKVFIISRRGNLPKKHFEKIHPTPNLILVSDAKNGVLFLTRKIRNFLRQNPQYDLRYIVDSIRQSTTELWQNLDVKNQKLFLRLLPYWNIFRHRAPAASIEMIEGMIKTGQVELKKKGVKKISEKNGKIFVQIHDEEIECDYVVNCLGFEFKPEKYPLLKQMIESGLLKKDLLMVESLDPKIHLLGGLNIGRDFECTAVPDLRVGVEKVINKIN